MNIDKIILREKMLLSKGSFYSRARDFFIILLLLLIFGYLIFAFSSTLTEIERDKISTPAIWGILLNFFAAYFCHLRVQHIQSIRYHLHREKSLTDKAVENADEIRS